MDGPAAIPRGPVDGTLRAARSGAPVRPVPGSPGGCMNAGPLADLMPGQPVFLWVSAPPGGLPDGTLGRELLLNTVQTITLAELHLLGTSRQWAVRARREEDDSTLRTLVSGGGVICLACGAETIPGEGTWLQVQAYPFAAE